MLFDLRYQQLSTWGPVGQWPRFELQFVCGFGISNIRALRPKEIAQVVVSPIAPQGVQCSSCGYSFYFACFLLGSCAPIAWKKLECREHYELSRTVAECDNDCRV